MVALVPLLDSGEQAHGLFLATLESPAIAMMRRGLIVGCLTQVLLADEHPGRLWSAQALATGVADERCSCGEVDVRNDRLFRSGIDEDGNALFLRDGADTADAQRALFCSRAGEDIDHRGAIGEFGA